MGEPPANFPSFGVLLRIAYDGRAFSGFARQANARTIAGELEGAIRSVDPHASPVRGASRTDAGVHARDQRVAFDSALDIPPKGWAFALKQQLCNEIAVVGAARVDLGYDPRRYALTKTYRYLILQSEVPDPFWVGRAWRLRKRLNLESCRAEAAQLVGRYDFRAFRSSADERTDTVRTILRAEVNSLRDDSRCLAFDLQGDRFMHRMARIIVGTVADVARGRLHSGAISRALQSGRRDDLGVTAPPEGLYLETLELSDEGRDNWPNHSAND